MRLTTFPFDTTLVAPCIYRSDPHRATSLGVSLAGEYRQELRRLLTEFLEHNQAPETGVYLRLDCFLQPEENLAIIEINASFVDGWGTALNLSRAAGHPLNLAGISFPEVWTSRELAYRPELQLAVSELQLGGARRVEVLEPDEALASKREVYWYGRFENYAGFPLVRPAAGIRLDNKTLLARFSREWNGRLITIPPFYLSDQTPWEQIPPDVVFKLCNKSEDPRNSIRFRDELGNGKYFRRMYKEGGAVAQQRITPLTLRGGEPTQLIILAIGSKPVTGYLQIAQPGTRVINDNSVHGPLVFED